jgi:AbrB family looped-hinge helix DNA binding protein
MSAVKLSPKYQVVIPRDVREHLKLRPGQRLDVFIYDGRIELVPVRKRSELRGFVRGIDTSVPRDGDWV